MPYYTVNYYQTAKDFIDQRPKKFRSEQVKDLIKQAAASRFPDPKAFFDHHPHKDCLCSVIYINSGSGMFRVKYGCMLANGNELWVQDVSFNITTPCPKVGEPCVWP